MPDARAGRIAPTSVAGSDASQSISIVRDFDAPRERVWRAWTRGDALIRWYGPKFYPAADVSAEVRVGGAWRACLKSESPGGRDLWQSGRYLVVIPPERLEFTFAWEMPDHEDGPGIESHVVMRLEELEGGGTRMHFTQSGLRSVATADSHSAGWSSTFERLAAILASRTAGQPPGLSAA